MLPYTTPAATVLRKAHSAVESNINMLEHHGLNRCVDKGLHGYRRNVGLSVLAYNLHITSYHRQYFKKTTDTKRREEPAGQKAVSQQAKPAFNAVA